VTIGRPGRMSVPVISAGGKLFLRDGTVAATLEQGWDLGTLDSDEYLKIDFRTFAETVNNDATLYIHYTGHLHVTPMVRSILEYSPNSKSTGFGDQKMFITLNVETSSLPLDWMNQTVFVGRGRFDVEAHISSIVYEVFAATA